MAPSQLTIATSSLSRLIREESSYHAELAQQQSRLTKLETEPDDGNKEYLIKQEKTAIEETKRMFPRLETNIATAREKVQSLLTAGGGSEEDVAKAKEVLATGKN